MLFPLLLPVGILQGPPRKTRAFQSHPLEDWRAPRGARGSPLPASTLAPALPSLCSFGHLEKEGEDGGEAQALGGGFALKRSQQQGPQWGEQGDMFWLFQNTVGRDKHVRQWGLDSLAAFGCIYKKKAHFDFRKMNRHPKYVTLSRSWHLSKPAL